MSFLAARRRSLAMNGRPMTLRRLASGGARTDVTLQGFLSMFRPDQVGQGSIAQGDGTIAILNDEITAAGWPGPPRARDQMVIDSRVWIVLGASPIFEGTDTIGFTVSVRGG